MPLPDPYRRMLVPVYLPSLVLAVSSEAMLVLLPLYVLEQGFGASFAALVVGMRGVGVLLFDLPAGALVARFGDRPVLLGGPAAVAAGIGLCVVAESGLALTLSALLLGVGHAAWMLARQAYIAQHCTPDQIGRAIGVMAGLQRAGQFAGPALGGVVASAAGFASALTAAAIGAVCAIGIVWRYSGSTGPSAGPAAVPTLGVVARHGRVFATAGIAALTLQFMRAARQLLIPLFGQSLGLDVAAIGFVYSMSAAVDMSLFYPVGVLIDRRGRRWSALPCMALFILALALLPLAAGFYSLLGIGLLLGLANGLGTGIVLVIGADFARASATPGQFLGIWRLIGDVGFSGAPLLTGALVEFASLAVASATAAGIGLVGLLLMALCVPETRALAPVVASRAPAGAARAGRAGGAGSEAE